MPIARLVLSNGYLDCKRKCSDSVDTKRDRFNGKEHLLKFDYKIKIIAMRIINEEGNVETLLLKSIFTNHWACRNHRILFETIVMLLSWYFERLSSFIRARKYYYNNFVSCRIAVLKLKK